MERDAGAPGGCAQRLVVGIGGATCPGVEIDPTIERALRAVLDPEIGVNIVDLGLLYGAVQEGEVARVTMTMTTPACPMHETLTEDVRAAVEAMVPGVRTVEVELVFEPRWTPERMSDEAKQQLGW